MDRDKLKHDMENDPHLQGFAFDNVDQLVKKLTELHRFLLGPEGGLAGYLYQEQTRQVKKLKNNC